MDKSIVMVIVDAGARSAALELGSWVLVAEHLWAAGRADTQVHLVLFSGYHGRLKPATGAAAAGRDACSSFHSVTCEVYYVLVVISRLMTNPNPIPMENERRMGITV